MLLLIDKDFDVFYGIWSMKIDDIKNILRYIHTYPEISRFEKIGEIITADEVDDVFKNWFMLWQKIENRFDKDFYRPYWLPVIKNEISCFIDLSNENLKMFETHYLISGPIYWHSHIIFDDIRKLMLVPDLSNFDFNEFISSFNEEKWKDPYPNEEFRDND